MKASFVLEMPDEPRTFLTACRITAEAGVSISRVSYNKAIDIHTIFIDTEGTEEQIQAVSKRFLDCGYMPEKRTRVETLLLECSLPDKPGACIPVLEAIGSQNISISYASSHTKPEGRAVLKLGLLIENPEDVDACVKELSALSDVRILNYNTIDHPLDNTIFYLSFANAISKWHPLTRAQADALVADANRILQGLEGKQKDPQTTFTYICRYAEFLTRHKGEGYIPRISKNVCGNLKLFAIEPPCGSTTYLIDAPEGVIAVDAGYPCYAEDLHKAILSCIPDFDTRKKECILTHMDMDHSGGMMMFDRVHMSQRTLDNFEQENMGMPDFREGNDSRAPFYRISSILSDDHRYDTAKMHALNTREPDYTRPLSPIGSLNLFGLTFEVFEGAGGHVDGEIVFFERAHRLCFTGDVMINAMSLTEGQQEFNTIAPYLLSSVNQNSDMARKERHALAEAAEPGEWLVCGGHGAPFPFAFGMRK
ncbi:MAG: hypothetical protein Q4Q04_00020 [Methanocorpusculum sp.]|nr:hypothetical protein [Methanocorpusculum sp.]